MSAGGAPSSSRTEVVPAAGTLYPADGTGVDPEDVRTYLRELGVLGAVAVRPRDALAEAVADLTGTGDPVELSFATDGLHVSVLRDGALAVGPTLDDVVAGLAERFVCVAEVGEAFADGTPAPDPADGDAVGDEMPVDGPIAVDLPESRRASVLLCRLKPEYLPVLARVSGSPVRVLEVGGWRVVELGEDADTERYPWLGGDLPVWVLDLQEGTRSISATVDPGATKVPLFLSPTWPWSTTFAADEVDGAVAGLLELLADPTRDPGSAVGQLLARPAVAHVDGERLRAALASPDDGGWFARVLEALGLPLVAAEVVEGRADLSGVTVVEPAGLGSVIWQGMDLYVDDALRQGDGARGLRRWYAGIVREPRRMLLTAVPEVVLGLGVLWWAWQHGSGVLRVVVTVVALALLGDAVGDVILLRRAARRRVGAWAPRG